MKLPLKTGICIGILSGIFSVNSIALPPGFVYLHEIDPTIIQEIKYFSTDNFMGRPVQGYAASQCILTQAAADALKQVQQQLKARSLGLKVYDCYRPQTAVNDFIAWSQDSSDQKMKARYYPHENKAYLFKRGYIATKSGHSRGSTVDLTIVRYNANHQAVESAMGTRFDFLDELSFPLTNRSHAQILANRLLLRTVMQQAGFEPYDKEWWHFTLKNEPYPTTFFDFLVK